MPKISQLPAATTLANTDILLADSYGGTNTRKIAYGDLKAGIQEDSMSVFALKGETATDTQVANSVNAWLNSHVTPTGSTVVIDDTLTVQGAAADAKAAGAARGKIPVITVGSSSTATAFVATLDGVTSLTEGLSFYLYNNKTYNNFATTDSIAATEWSSPVALTESSLDTYNTAIVYLYQRATSTPSKPSSSLTYTFSSGALSGTLGNWSQTIPTGSNTLYVTAATAYSRSTTDSIAAAEWTAPAVVIQNTATGATGINIASVFLYQRASSAPSKPSSSLTYTFSSGALSGTLGSWSQTIPAATGQTCYETHATAILPGQQTTLNLNSLGAKTMFTRDGRLIPLRSFLVGDTVLVTYSTKFVESGCWIVDLLPAIANGGGYSSVYVRNDSMDPVSIGRCSFAGGVAMATGGMSFAYGTYNTSGGLTTTSAEASNAFAFGLGSHALANGAVVLGQGNTASGGVSFATGSYTQAKGSRGFVAGNHTISSENAMSQAVFGNANVEDVEGKYAFIVGNGNVSVGSGTGLNPEIYEPSNALALDWEGNLELAGGVTVGGIEINPSTARKLVSSANEAEYNLYVPIDEIVYGDIDETTGANDTASSNTKRLRLSTYIPVAAGDTINLSNPSSVQVFVGSYHYDSSQNTYVYNEALKNYSDSATTHIEINEDSYIRFAVGYTNNSNITNNRATFELLTGYIKISLYRKVGKTFDDPFEWGSLLINDLENGILGNDSDHYCHRSKHMYKVEGSSVLGVVFDPSDLSYNETITVNVLLFIPSFTEMKVISRYIDRSNPNFSILIPDGYSYAQVFLQRGSTQTTQFHNARIVSDVFLDTSYLPYPATHNEQTSAIEIQAIGSRYNALGFNYRVFGSVMTSGRLRLPPNYSINGNKVPLVVDVHGSSAMTNWEYPLSNTATSARSAHHQLLLDEGYAVFDCFPFGDKAFIDYDVYSPFLIPLNCRAYVEGIKYVCEHFNVDVDNVALLAHSQGGYIGHWAYMQSEFPFRAVGMFSTTSDPVAQNSNKVFYNPAARLTLTNLVDFAGTSEEIDAFVNDGLKTTSLVMSFLNKNKGKIVAMSPYAVGIHGATSVDELFDGAINTLETVPQWLLDDGCPARQSAYDLIPYFASHSTYSKNATCPVKFWGAFDDTQVSTYGTYAIHKYLLNGGSDSEYRIMPLNTGGHHCTNVSEPTSLRTSGTTSLGYAYQNMPVAWVEFVEFINRYMR